MAELEYPGEEVPDSKVKDSLKKRIQNLFEEHVADSNFNSRRFPGSHPVSLTRDHLINPPDYLICEKSDGVRYLLYLPSITNIRGVNECHAFLIDRKNSFWRITVLLPATAIKADCLFDVELVLDHGTDMRILIFDTLFLGGVCFMHNNYFERLQAAWYGLVYPVRESQIKGKKSIEIYLKDFYRTTEIDFLWNHVRYLLPHKSDGLIFTAVNAEYTIGTNQAILKWKPNDLNTLDFVARRNGKGLFDLFTQGRGLEKFAEMRPDPNDEIKDGDIIECLLVENEWTLYKVRSDKTTPNSTEVASKIVKSIQDNVGIEELITIFKNDKKIKLK